MAQGSTSGRVGGLELGAGINVFGPAGQMGDLMVEYGFDQQVMDWVAFEQIQYPDYAPLGIGIQASYMRNLNYGKSVGVTAHYSRLRVVSGYSAISGRLDILLSSIYLAPTFSLALGQYIEIKAGPSLMINSGRTTNLYEENVTVEPEKRTRLAPGLLTGVNFWLWYGTNTYGKIGAQSILTIPHEMGPFSGIYGFGERETLPESKMGYSHLNMVFIFGVHLWKLDE